MIASLHVYQARQGPSHAKRSRAALTTGLIPERAVGLSTAARSTRSSATFRQITSTTNSRMTNLSSEPFLKYLSRYACNCVGFVSGKFPRHPVCARKIIPVPEFFETKWIHFGNCSTRLRYDIVENALGPWRSSGFTHLISL